MIETRAWLPHVIRQVAWHLTARPQEPPAWLGSAEAELFARMAPADQREGLAVVKTLTAWGQGSDRSLLVAGLLHDAGKSLASTGVAYRIASALVQGVRPLPRRALARRLRGLAILTDHAALGAEMAREAGLPEDVQTLIARHHLPPTDARQRLLWRADELH